MPARHFILYLTICFALSICLFSGCDTSGDGPETTSDVLIPLETGNEWTVQTPTGNLTLEVTDPTTVDVVGSGFNIKAENQPEGTLIRGEDFDLQVYDPAMLLKYPVEAGESYQHTDGKPSTFSVSVTEETVTVPAGEFECLAYTIERLRQGGNSRSDIRKVWVKPGLGPVRLRQEDGLTASLISTNVDL